MRVCNFTGSRPLGAPKDWDQQLDGPCDALPVVDHIDEQSGFNFMFSVWRPEPAELEALMNGGAVRLGISGSIHPVVNMAVITPEACASAEVVELPA